MKTHVLATVSVGGWITSFFLAANPVLQGVSLLVGIAAGLVTIIYQLKRWNKN